MEEEEASTHWFMVRAVLCATKMPRTTYVMHMPAHKFKAGHGERVGGEGATTPVVSGLVQRLSLVH